MPRPAGPSFQLSQPLHAPRLPTSRSAPPSPHLRSRPVAPLLFPAVSPPPSPALHAPPTSLRYSCRQLNTLSRAITGDPLPSRWSQVSSHRSPLPRTILEHLRGSR